jgi:hypothetical protein
MAWNHCTKFMFELHFLFQIFIFMFLKNLMYFYIYPRVMGGKHADYEFYNLFYTNPINDPKPYKCNAYSNFINMKISQK